MSGKKIVTHVLAGNLNTASRAIRQALSLETGEYYKVKIVCLQKKLTPIDEDLRKRLSFAELKVIESRVGVFFSLSLIRFIWTCCFEVLKLSGGRGLVHWHERTTGPIMFISRMVRVPYIYDVHDVTHHEFMVRKEVGFIARIYNRVSLFLERFGASGAVEILGVSEAMKGYLSQFFSRETGVIYDPSLPSFDQKAPCKTGIHGISYWGKIGQERLDLELLRQLLEREISVSLVGPIRDESYRNQVLRWIEERPSFLEWIDEVPTLELGETIQSDKVAFFPIPTLSPNLKMMLPNKFWQAAFLQMPMMCYEGSEMADRIEENALGIVLSREATIEEMIEGYLAIKEREEFYQGQIAAFLERFSSMEDELLKAYKRILNDEDPANF